MRTLSITSKWLAPAAFAFALSLAPLQPLFATASAASPVVAQPQATAQVSDEEAAGLIFMVQEEKLAHDLYLALNKVWPQRVFTNIAKAELTHMNAVRGLLDLYGLEDPTIGLGPGEFEDTGLQALYDELFASGSASLAAALEAGVAVEVEDIADLEERLEQTSEPAITQVYTNLLAGSENHLKAFTRVLERQTGAGTGAADSSAAPTVNRGRGPQRGGR